MLPYSRSLFAVLLACILFSCNRKAVVLDYTNAKDEVPRLGNLVFRFSRPLVRDSMLGQWDSTEYIRFEPAISGRFRWEHGDELVFSPAQPLAPATSYTAIPGRELLRYSEFDKIENGDKIAFHTPGLSLDNTNITWVLADENGKTAVPQVDLYFNYAVNPGALKDKLGLTLDGKPALFSLQTVSAGSRISLRLMNMKTEDKDYELGIALDRGLLPEGGANATTEKINSRGIISSPFTLNINDVNSEHDGTRGTITIRTSQQIVADDISRYIRIVPAVKFTAVTTEEGLTISGEGFDVNRGYSLILAKGLRGRIGGVLKEDFQSGIAFGKLQPAINFTNSKAVYLGGQGLKNIEVKLVGVPKVKVIISKIYENNILSAQRNGYFPAEKDRHGNEYEDGEDAQSVSGDVIYEKEIETRSLPLSGQARLFNFNIEDNLPGFRGIYHIKIRSTEDYWVSDSRFISVSDLGLIAREGREKLTVFLNSVKTAKPVSGVNVLAYGSNNQLLGTAVSGADGVAEINYTKSEYSGFRPAMIIARTDNDFTYLPFTSTRINTSRFDVGGKRSNATGLDAFVYAERDIYRPGERVNFSVIIRNRQWKSPGEIPLKLKFLMPNGRELKSFRKNLNEQGSIEGNIEVAASAITGTYTLEVYNGNDVLLSTKNFMVEDFVPDRVKLNARLDKESLQPGENARISINAMNFFGPPAAHRNFECEVQVKQQAFNPKKFNRYNFSIANPGISFDKMVKEGKTDENGNAAENFTIKPEYKNAGLLQATFFATVFDETGRPVSRRVRADIFTQPHFFGIGEDGWGYYPLGQVIKFPLVAIDKSENQVSATAKVEIIRHEYRTVLTRSGSYFRYESQEEDKLIASQQVMVSGENTVFPFVPRAPGNYEIRVSLPGAGSYVKKEFYSYGYWGGDNSSFEVNTEGNIDIEADKSSYLAGENARILFKTPFSGRLLVTMETDNVLSYQYVDVQNRSASLDLKLTPACLPNVYVTATLIKPHGISDIPLTVAHGFRSLRVEEKSRRLEVQVMASKQVRSHSRQEVRIKATPGSFVSLAAVDNGVLQVSDFATPDPYAYFYGKKALETGAYDMYPLLFPEIRARLSSTGGDGDLEMDKRINPVQNKRVKIMSYWGGMQRTNSSGEAVFSFDIPQFSGEIRLMAVAYKDDRFGSSELNMKVADPIVLSTALPRFLSPGDTVVVPVSISNTTSKSTTATASLTLSPSLQALGETAKTVSLGANAESRVSFRVIAPAAIGAERLTVRVDGPGERFTDITDITVRPASTLQKLSGSGSIPGNGLRQVNIGTGDFIKGTGSYRLVVSRSPALELASQLQYLVNYPFGCTEQTISTAFPQLYYGDLAELLNTAKGNRASANANVLEAIRKIKLRQLYNGGITLWDGEGTEQWWTSVYAAHFLYEAKRAGYEVDKNLLETLLNYLGNKLRSRETITYYYNQSQQKKIAPKEVAYSLYVLALAGRPNAGTMNFYKANPSLLALDSRYLLPAAYAVEGDKESYRALLPGAFAGELSVGQTGGSFCSDIRDEAIALNALVDVDPGNAQVPVMARHVADRLKARDWYSTQESAFSFLAIGKIAREASKSGVTATITAAGKTAAVMSGNGVSLTGKELGSTAVTITAKGEGRLYYWWMSEGISASGAYREEDNFIKVRRRFYSRNGQPISGNHFKQNELVVVQLTLEKSYGGRLDNIVLTDLLPAGFEIENPRTKEIPGMDWIRDGGVPTALDVRDDRIHFFVNLTTARQVYYYAVRAVSPGVYHMGPVSADAMYSGEYHSYNGAGVIRITE